MRNCSGHQQFLTWNLGEEPGAGASNKWEITVRTTSSFQHGTSDFRQMENLLESQLDWELDTESRAQNQGQTYPQTLEMMRKIVNSEGLWSTTPVFHVVPESL